MATLHQRNGEQFLVISKDEATQMIALLVAQLANTSVRGHYVGACPSTHLVTKELDTEKILSVTSLSISIEPDKKGV